MRLSNGSIQQNATFIGIGLEREGFARSVGREVRCCERGWGGAGDGRLQLGEDGVGVAAEVGELVG